MQEGALPGKDLRRLHAGDVRQEVEVVLPLIEDDAPARSPPAPLPRRACVVDGALRIVRDDFSPVQLADLPLLDEAARLDHLAAETVLEDDGDHTPGRRGRFDNAVRLVDTHGNRLLEHDVEARMEARHREVGVERVRGDHDGEVGGQAERRDSLQG